MKYLEIILIAVCGICIGSCCSTASSCGGSELGFSIQFITKDYDYYYFNEQEDVDLKVFYGDSIFINVKKWEAGDPDSTLITFYWDMNLAYDHYTILANDTLLGDLSVEYGSIESTCCGTSPGIVDYSFESDQKFSTEFGLQIIL